jgi:hypothetical protein
VLHVIKVAGVHLLHHVHLIVLLKISHVISVIKRGCCLKLWIHKLGHAWIHKHLGRHRHAHLLLVGLIEMTLILVLVMVLVVEVLTTHVGVIVHSHVVEQRLLLLMLHEEWVCRKRQFSGVVVHISATSLIVETSTATTTVKLLTTTSISHITNFT